MFLRGFKKIANQVGNSTVAYLQNKSILLKPASKKIPTISELTSMAPSPELQKQISYPPEVLPQFTKFNKIEFPKFTGVQCNMMPFKMNDKNSIPKEYQPYWNLIEACEIPENQRNGVWFLTVTESHVKKGATQRRPGIHTEKHPKSAWGGGGWGGGKEPKVGGVYMASTSDQSSRFWNCRVEQPGNMGDCEHLKDQLKNPIYLESNRLAWLTDSCPHEALPQNEGKRQYFRLVAPEVSLWYKAHSTPNPLVALPEGIKIIENNKFGLS